jgi:hypothetical protein
VTADTRGHTGVLRSRCAREGTADRGGPCPRRCIARSALVPSAMTRPRRPRQPLRDRAPASAVIASGRRCGRRRGVPRIRGDRERAAHPARTGRAPPLAVREPVWRDPASGGGAVRSQPSAGTSPMATSRPATTCHRALTRRHFRRGKSGAVRFGTPGHDETRSRAGCGYRHALIRRPA